MSSYAQWLAQRASSADTMQLHTTLLPAGDRMAAEYRRLLSDPAVSHLWGAIRSRLADLEQTISNLRGAQAA